MNRRELLQSMASVPILACLPMLPEQPQFLTFAPVGVIRGSINYNRSGGRFVYSIATDRRPKVPS